MGIFGNKSQNQQPFNEEAYKDAKDALQHVSTARLENLRSSADTPAKAKALDEAIAERSDS